MIPLCDETGHPIPFCDCDRHDPGKRELTPLHRRDRSDRADWLNPEQEKRLRDALRDLPEMAVTVSYLLRGERIGDGHGATPAAERSVVNVSVIDLTRRGPYLDDPIAHVSSRGIVTTLASWVRLAHGEMLDEGETVVDPDDLPTVAGECGWLLRHVVWVLAQQWVTEMAEDVAGLVKECRAVLKEREAYRPRCQHCPSGRMVDEGSGYWTCNTCTRTSRDARMGLRDAITKQEPMTAAQIAQAFDVQPATLRKWVERGYLSQAVDGDGNLIVHGKAHTFHVVDVLRVKDTGICAS